MDVTLRALWRADHHYKWALNRYRGSMMAAGHPNPLADGAKPVPFTVVAQDADMASCIWTALVCAPSPEVRTRVERAVIGAHLWVQEWTCPDTEAWMAGEDGAEKEMAVAYRNHLRDTFGGESRALSGDDCESRRRRAAARNPIEALVESWAWAEFGQKKPTAASFCKRMRGECLEDLACDVADELPPEAQVLLRSALVAALTT